MVLRAVIRHLVRAHCRTCGWRSYSPGLPYCGNGATAVPAVQTTDWRLADRNGGGVHYAAGFGGDSRNGGFAVDAGNGGNCRNSRPFGKFNINSCRPCSGGAGPGGGVSLGNDVGAEAFDVCLAFSGDHQRGETLGGSVEAAAVGEGGAQAEGCGTGCINGSVGTSGGGGLGGGVVAGNGGVAGGCSVGVSVCGGFGAGSGVGHCLRVACCFCCQLRGRCAEKVVGGLLRLGGEDTGNGGGAGSADGNGACCQDSGGYFAGGKNGEQRHKTLQKLDNTFDSGPAGGPITSYIAGDGGKVTAGRKFFLRPPAGDQPRLQGGRHRYDRSMPTDPEPTKKASTWQTTVDSNKALLLRKTGKDTAHWAGQARAAGIKDDGELRTWMRDGFGVTGYSRYAVSWEMFGYPEFMLRDADELMDGQYAGYPQLRPVADAILGWAAATEGVQIQMRKGYVSLHSPRRKFAQVTRTTTTAVDVTLRLDAPAEGRIEAARTRADDPFTRKVRLTSVDQVDDELLDILVAALEQNS